MRHKEGELSALRAKLLEMSGLVESGIVNSVNSLVKQNPVLAAQVIANEQRVNRMQVEIDAMATRLLALEAPVAVDLRLIMAAMRINTDLERMSDLAVNIAQRAQSLMKKTLVKPSIDIPYMAALTETMVRTALDSFVKADVDLARIVLDSDDAVDQVRDAIYQELIRYMEKESSAVQQCVDFMFVARDLERIADHATNIAEDVLYAIEGVDVRLPASRAAHP